jgi:DNA-directed RNA polymerase specialized sigma24 family protein
MAVSASLTRDHGPVRTAEQVTIANLYAAHRLRLVRLAVMLVDDQETAEDVVQDVFAKLHRGWRLRDPDRALAYLQRAVVNASRSVLRRRRYVRRHVEPHEPPAGGPEASAILAEEHRPDAEYIVWSALHGLAVLVLEGPLRAFDPARTQAIEERLLNLVEQGP